MKITHFKDEYRKIYTKKLRKKLKNTDICLISSNCNGACILHDLGLQFKSPFVNLWIEPKDYIKMLYSLEEYMSYDIIELKNTDKEYPVGMLKDIKIYFQHYKTFEEAKNKWIQRKSRMDYKNIYILFTDRDGCTEEDLINFDKLPYNKKIVFVNKPYSNIKSAYYIKGFENDSSVGLCMNYKSKLSYKKYYDYFNYVDWFNDV